MTQTGSLAYSFKEEKKVKVVKNHTEVLQITLKYLLSLIFDPEPPGPCEAKDDFARFAGEDPRPAEASGPCSKEPWGQDSRV